MSGTPCFQHDSYQRDCSDCWHDEPATPPQPAPAQADTPACYASLGQIERIVDSDDEGGTYIPLRKSPRGNFTTPLYMAQAGVEAQGVAQWECERGHVVQGRLPSVCASCPSKWFKRIGSAPPALTPTQPVSTGVTEASDAVVEALRFRMTRLEEMGDEIDDMTPEQAQAEYHALGVAIAALKGGRDNANKG